MQKQFSHLIIPAEIYDISNPFLENSIVIPLQSMPQSMK